MYERKHFVKVAKKLNEVMEIDPPIDVKLDDEKLKIAIIEASDYISPEDNFSNVVLGLIDYLKKGGSETEKKAKKKITNIKKPSVLGQAKKKTIASEAKPVVDKKKIAKAIQPGKGKIKTISNTIMQVLILAGESGLNKTEIFLKTLKEHMDEFGAEPRKHPSKLWKYIQSYVPNKFTTFKEIEVLVSEDKRDGETVYFIPNI